MSKSILAFLLTILFISVKGQSQSHDKNALFSNPLKAYFNLDRENIHLQVNKDTYITNEKIWFKGYIIEKKTAKPYPATVNVYITLINSEGKNVLTNLYYSENSLFDGYIILDAKLKSGKYRLRVFTNFMNNFREDESTVIPISIVNEQETSYTNYKMPNYKSLDISLFPESGVFVEGITNTIAVKITDCNGNGIAVTNGNVTAPNGEVISNFSTNQQGFGKFEIINTQNGIYQVDVEIQNKKFQQILPSPKLSGISFSANNYASAEYMVLKIKINERTLQDIAGKKYTFIIHQNQVLSSADFTFKAGEKEASISISSQYLSDGLNTIRLIDNDNNQVAERIIFKPFPIKSNTGITINRQRTDSIVFQGKSPLALASLSISALPTESASVPNTSIYSSFYLDNFIKSTIQNSRYYLNDFNRKKHFELDNVLITTSSKYDWQAMLKSPPEKKFDFDSGLTIKGTVNSAVANKDKVSVMMSSAYLGINEKAPLNSRNEFQFDNVLAIDSTTMFFSLLDDKGRYTKLNMFTRLVNPMRQFIRTSIEQSISCLPGIDNKTEVDLPEIRDAIVLNAVTVEGKKSKDELGEKYKFRFNNNMSRGYKITETEAGTFRDVLQWIGSHGFNVSTVAGRVSITRSYSMSFQGENSPSIFIDDAPLTEVDLLLNMSMANIDEIYINRSGYGSGSTGGSGIIRIYTKIPSGALQSSIKINSQSLLINNGYQALKLFKNPDYSNVNNQSFKQFGTIAWINNVNTDASGQFRFSIPNLYQESIVLLVEGISADGHVVSEQITVAIPNN